MIIDTFVVVLWRSEAAGVVVGGAVNAYAGSLAEGGLPLAGIWTVAVQHACRAACSR